MKKPIKYYCDLFGANFVIFHNWEEIDFILYVQKHFKRVVNVVDADGLTDNFIWNDGHIILLWTRKGARALSTLVHECVHATNASLASAGVLADFKNDEVQAYYVQRLFNIASKGK